MVEVIVEYDYTAKEPDELTIKKGDIIKDVIKKQGGWWEGVLKDKKGMFPDNFVRPIDKESSVILRNKKDVTRIRQCRVVFSYNPHHEDELTLKVGDVINVVGEEEEGWWRGLLNGKEGVFPSNFVEETSLPPKPSNRDQLDSLLVGDADPPRLPTKPTKQLCEVRYPYKAQNEDELSLKEGDIVTLLSKDSQDPGWWRGELNGKSGVFPDNFVILIPIGEEKSSSKDEKKTTKLATETGAIKPSSIASQRKSLEVKSEIKTEKPSLDSTVTPTKTTPPVPGKKPVITVKKSPSGSGSGLFSEIRKKLVDVVDGAAGSKSSPMRPESAELKDNSTDAFDQVERRPLLTDVRATRAKAPGRRLPTTLHKDDEHPNIPNGNVEHLVDSTDSPDLNTSGPNANSSIESDGEKPRLREWEKHKAPWLEEMKLNQAKRTSTSPGPPAEGRVKLTPTGDKSEEDRGSPVEKEVQRSITLETDTTHTDSPVKLLDNNMPVTDLIPEKSKCTSPIYLDNINVSFASLNINESSPTYKTDSIVTTRLSQSYRSSSVPYMKLSSPCPFIPVRNKFSDCAYEDEIDISDQPIDFSQKYSETKLPDTNTNNTSASSERNYSYQQKNENESFSIYAETDLDQPTDYSLRYAEDDSDSDICLNINKNVNQGYMQDTIKTYCTEDTPYETPFNFSTSTSMSDLRIVDDKPIIDNDKVKESHAKEEIESVEEKELCSTEDVSEMENQSKPMDKITKSEFSSGLMSPEKPVNYCEEGTPGYFSRVSSFGSLNSIPVNDSNKKDCESTEQESTMKTTEKVKISPEAKAVKFESVVNYAEETPLMFSRSSSLASLDSIEQHSIHDDRSSVISDFSRLTSGIVSPSELPDSPTQIVPPSPKSRKTSLDFPSSSRSKRSLEGRPQPSIRVLPKPSIFEDNVTKFKEESTPVQFSTATSLSSLTIDDHEEASGPVESIAAQEKHELLVKEEIEENSEKKDTEKESDVNDESEDEGDADILEACINMGMQTNHQPIISSTSTPVFKFTPKPNLSLPPKINPRVMSQPITQPAADTLRTYCTEDTPAGLSHAGSNSDLSILSGLNNTTQMKSIKDDDLSDDSSNLSDNDNILEECIQSGMPKPKKGFINTSLQPISPLPRRETPIGSNSPNVKFTSTRSPNANPSSRKEQSLPPYLTVGDELENYAVENSPCQFSLRSSLSDLTVDGSVAGLKRSPISVGQSQPSSVTTVLESGPAHVSYEDDPVHLRCDSLSSISVDSLGSIEAEQALLEQCISSGKPKSNSASPTTLLDVPNTKTNVKRIVEAPVVVDKPKNVNAASVARRTIKQIDEASPDKPLAAAGVRENPELELETKITGSRESTLELEKTTFQIESHNDSSQDRWSLIGETSSEDLTKNGSEANNRMLDPDAMIESLDRFTAELVSHSEDRSKMLPDDNWDNYIAGSDSSAMTDSILIAIEASKIANVLKTEADMSLSTTSIGSLELDNIQPPSQMNSLIHSTISLDRNATNSPKLMSRKKYLSASMLLRSSMSSSLNLGSSLESLSNLDQVNPPSELMFDMESSVNSITSLPTENDVKTNFIINGVVNREMLQQPICSQSNACTTFICNDVNSDALFNEITDFCNSFTEKSSDTTNSLTTVENNGYDDITPVCSNSNSAKSTPKRQNLKKHMLIKQRHNSAKDRYKTYTIGTNVAINDNEDVIIETSTAKLTPKEKRQLVRSRFETRVLDKAVTDILQQPVIEPTTEIVATKSLESDDSKSNIRKSFRQKRLENKDRFKTRTLLEPSISPATLVNSDIATELHLQKEADAILKTLRDSKMIQDELFDCETISLVSNDDDRFEQNFTAVIDRTYLKNGNLQDVIGLSINNNEGCDLENIQVIVTDEVVVEEEPIKEVHIKRKPLYAKYNVNSENVTKIATSKSVRQLPVKKSEVSCSSPVKVPISKVSKRIPRSENVTCTKSVPLMERQGTFTKTEQPVNSGNFKKPSTRIPTLNTTRIPTSVSTNLNNAGKPPLRAGSGKLTKLDKVNKNVKVNNRSASADNQESVRRIQQSVSSQSLKNDSRLQYGAYKKSSIPSLAQRSNNHSNINSNNCASIKKQVTSKVACLWKKNENAKMPKKDLKTGKPNGPKVNSEAPRLIRTNTFDNKDGQLKK